VASQYRLIVFDLDGTLVDSRRDLAESANLLLEASGGRELPEETIGRMVGDGAATLVSRVFEAAGVVLPPDGLDRFLEIYNGRLLNHTRPYLHVPEVLETLAGRAALAVLTNKPLSPTRVILSGLALNRYFDDEAVVGGDGPFLRKPDAAGLRYLIARTGVPVSSTLLVGDSMIDWRAARNAGTAMCLARYGFGSAPIAATDLDLADHVIETPLDLLVL
jgi:phosphoglycolate phosphatase